MNNWKVFNWIMIALVIISAIMAFTAPLYCTPEVLEMIIEHLAGRY